jgi:hypothetical protein
MPSSEPSSISPSACSTPAAPPDICYDRRVEAEGVPRARRWARVTQRDRWGWLNHLSTTAEAMHPLAIAADGHELLLEDAIEGRAGEHQHLVQRSR